MCQELKAELEKLREEHVYIQGKYLSVSEAGQKHFTKAKQLEEANAKLISRSKYLKTLLKEEKEKSSAKSSGVDAAAKTDVDGAVKMDVDAATKTNADGTSSSRIGVNGTMKIGVDGTAKMGVDGTTSTTSVNITSRTNVDGFVRTGGQGTSGCQNAGTNKEGRLPVPGMSVHVATSSRTTVECTGLRTPGSASRLRIDLKRTQSSPALQRFGSSGKKPLLTSSSRRELVLSAHKEQPASNGKETKTSPPNRQQSSSSRTQLPASSGKEPKTSTHDRLKNSSSRTAQLPASPPSADTAGPSQIRKTVSSSKLLTKTPGVKLSPRVTRGSTARRTRDKPEQPADHAKPTIREEIAAAEIGPPRVTRRSLGKRQSMDGPGPDGAGGKKSKLSLAEPDPEPAATKGGRGSKLPLPRTARAKKDMSSCGTALATITNSPKKVAPRGKAGPSGLLRLNKTPQRKLPVRQEAQDEGAGECTTQ
ncbi:serine/arginine repetitive matrix protein 2 [Aplysia californica]|uniref:Serine/arginine repetitive matrix protein 2 n=1 Tax=Aplysia californica TaxID=6500 RepID=A0ABM0JMB3_APLCA|nr:serine/arginine repetitive matrix protein 2 [Aplysia californica]